MLAKSTPLQDIGKVGIPDHVLLKPGKLTPEEWESMKIHARLGSDAIEQAEANAEKPVKDRKSNRLSRSMLTPGEAVNRRFFAGTRRDLQKGPLNGTASTVSDPANDRNGQRSNSSENGNLRK